MIINTIGSDSNFSVLYHRFFTFFSDFSFLPLFPYFAFLILFLSFLTLPYSHAFNLEEKFMNNLRKFSYFKNSSDSMSERKHSSFLFSSFQLLFCKHLFLSISFLSSFLPLSSPLSRGRKCFRKKNSSFLYT